MMDMSRSEFDKHILSLSEDPSSATFTRNDIIDKFLCSKVGFRVLEQRNFCKRRTISQNGKEFVTATNCSPISVRKSCI